MMLAGRYQTLHAQEEDPLDLPDSSDLDLSSHYSSRSWLFYLLTPWRYVTLSWLTPMMRKGLITPLESVDFPPMRKSMQASWVSQSTESYSQRISQIIQRNRRLSATLQAQQPLPGPFRTLFGLVWLGYATSCLLAIVSFGIRLFLPLILHGIIKYMSDPSKVSSLIIPSPLGLVLALFLLTCVSEILEAMSSQELIVVCLKLRTAIVNLISDKALKASYKTSLEFSEGRIIQMVSYDAMLISKIPLHLFKFILTVVQISLSVYILTQFFGVNLKMTAGVFVLAFLIIFLCIPFMKKLQISILKAGDDRIRLIREVFSGIKILKVRSLDLFFEKAIRQIRDFQLGYIRWFGVLCSIVAVVVTTLPIAIMIAVLFYFSRHDNMLDAAILFPTLSYTRLMFTPLQVIPNQLMNIVQAVISWGRLNKFLLADECDESTFVLGEGRTFDAPYNSSKESFKAVIEIMNGTFRWDVREKAALQDSAEAAEKKGRKSVFSAASLRASSPSGQESRPLFDGLDLRIKKGSLTAIVGPVGSGKSSLISAITSQMTRVSGTVNIYGRIALCFQEPWIVSRSVRDNILFDLPLVQSKLNATVESCAMQSDVYEFTEGLDTIVGERGVSLSGGQRARLALARAVYSNADIYLLDDPLAALDAHVGKHVFDNCILGILGSKTRILVTHQLQYLPFVDRVIVMDDGRILEDGSFEDLMNSDGKLADMMRNYRTLKDYKSEPNMDDFPADPLTPTHIIPKRSAASGGKVFNSIIQAEDRERGIVDISTFAQYFHISGGFMLMGVLVFVILAFATSDVFGGLFLTWWTANSFDRTNRYYFLWYAGINIFGMVSLLFLIIIACTQGFYASKAYHQKAIAGLFRAPMSFFDSQPLGRILNRLSKDVQEVDLQLWSQFIQTYQQIGKTISTVLVISYLTPSSLLITMPLCILFYFVTAMYRASNRELKRLGALANSPLLAYISEILSGAVTIRSFRAQGRSRQVIRHLNDDSTHPAFIQELIPIWLSFRISIWSSILVLGLSALGVFIYGDAPTVGFSITTVMSLAETLRMLVLFLSVSEMQMVCIERLDHYCRKLPKEDLPVKRDDPHVSKWPSSGSILFSGVDARYPSLTAPVIKNLNLEVAPGEKLGVVGRTGSGKSTLLAMLFRLIDRSKGIIMIDGIDINLLGLRCLRSRLEMIPQEPTLFSGTIRSNVDPEGIFDDDRIWNSLELVGMKESIAMLEGKLDAPVSDRGENFSVGEKQLLTLSRAILTRPKVLVLDEASSSIDAAADKLLQQSIRTHFASSTVLTIAHRLNTVMDYDRILVLDAGRAVEIGTPSELLAIPGGYFRRLVDASNRVTKTDIGVDK